jgi:predicted permease
VQTIPRDLRYAARLLLKSPGFSAVAILVLALGIGANTAVFSIVNAMLFQPIPSGGSGIVGIYSRDTAKPDDYDAFSWPGYAVVRGGREVFADVAAQTMTMVGLSEGERTRRSFAGIVSASYFSTLGVQLAAGRPFNAEEERPGAEIPVLIAGYQVARKAGLAPADLVGKTTRVNARDFTVIGVAPEGFAGTMALVAPEFWLPTGVFASVSGEMFTSERTTDLADPKSKALMLLGRLRDGVTVESAAAKLAVLSRQFVEHDPVESKDHELMVQKLPRLAVSTSPQTDTQTAALGALLMGMAGLVLLIACLNLANMLLARGTARRKEIALRLALGSGRGRVIRQLLLESLLIALVGGAAGLILAVWGTTLLTATFAAVLPLVVTFDASPDVRVLAATMGFCVLSTLAAGLAPAWRITRPDVLPDLKEQPADHGTGRRLSLRNLLVVGQVALSLALLTTAGLFLRGAVKASAADPGFPLEGGVVGGLDPALGGYDETRGIAAYRNILQRVRRTPGVESASLASLIPFGEFNEAPLVQKAGTPPAPEGQPEAGVEATLTIIGADYFDTLRLPVLRGRGFTSAEEQSAAGPLVAVIDEPLTRRLFGDEDPIGRRVQLERSRNRHFEVVGVVRGVRQDLFDQVPVPHIYLASGQNYRGSMHLHVRAAAAGPDGAEASLLGALRQQVRLADPGVPLDNLRTLQQHRDGSIALWAVNTGARLFSVFGGVALLLAIIGVYGVKSYVVSRRTREIGIRMALGASPSNVLWLVLRESLALTASGLGLGLLLAWGVAKAVSGILYEVSALDPVVFGIAPLVLGAAATAAAFLPARRATRIVPVRALRAE